MIASRRVVRDWGGLAIALALFALAGLVAWDAASYPVRRSYAQFGPEIFPYIVAAGLAGLALFTVGFALAGSFPEREPMNHGPVLWVSGAVLAQVVILTAGLGFIPASAALFGGAARGFGRKPLVLTVAVGGLVSALLFVLFRYGLGLSLPAGPLERGLDLILR